MTAHKHISRHEVVAINTSNLIGFIALLGLLAIICRAPVSDAADNAKASVQVAEQARTAAQPDTWERLDRQSKQMVNYEGIRK